MTCRVSGRRAVAMVLFAILLPWSIPPRKDGWTMIRRSLLIFLTMGPAVTFAADVEHRFLRISQPMETDKYATTSNVASIGYFYFLDRARKPEDLRIRVQIYRPANGDFELFQEDDAEIGAPLGRDPATLQFLNHGKAQESSQTGKVPVPGRLLRQDRQRGEIACLEFRVPDICGNSEK